MTASEVKQFVARTLVELGATTVFDIKETLFLDAGRCLAIAYQARPLCAVWCLDDGTVEFRDGEGRVLRTVILSCQAKMAA